MSAITREDREWWREDYSVGPSTQWRYSRIILRLLDALDAADAALDDLKADHDASVFPEHSPDRCDGCRLYAAYRALVAPPGPPPGRGENA